MQTKYSPSGWGMETIVPVTKDQLEDIRLARP